MYVCIIIGRSDSLGGWVVLLEGIAYLGFVASESHKEYVESMMLRKIFKEFGNSLSVLYREAFTADLKPLLEVEDIATRQGCLA
jgi:hypothetical protein